MEYGRRCSIFHALAILVILSAVDGRVTGEGPPPSPSPPPPWPSVRLSLQDKHVVLDNGILQVTLSNPHGSITRITYNNDTTQNLMAEVNPEFDRGYWDLVWQAPGITKKKGLLDRLHGTEFRVVLDSDDQVEISFTRTWNNITSSSSSSSTKNLNKNKTPNENKIPPLNIDKRYVMLRGKSGLYTYVIYDRPQGWPHFNLANTRLAIKLNKSIFKYMVVSDTRQREMPLPDDRFPNRSQPLAFPEAVLLTNPIEPQFRGEVDDKYQYAGDTKDIQVHGWISDQLSTGFWSIVPSNEFRSGGPTKQFLTSHVGPTSLSVLISSHYAGKELMANFKDGEPWRKVLGPIFIYLNTNINHSLSSTNINDRRRVLWEDAKAQLKTESNKWPYNFPTFDDYLKSHQRGSVSGKFTVTDSDSSSSSIAYIGLAKPGDPGSWQRESKGYQFWTTADQDGAFQINNVRPGNYTLYAFVTGFIGDYKQPTIIQITPRKHIDLGNIVYQPPRDGPTLWEIGIPDRSAREFFIPGPDPKYVNKLYLKHSSDRYRQYGLWDRYTQLYPKQDLIFTINQSDYTKDWFFAQVNRKSSNGTYIGTTWQIKFQLDQAAFVSGGTYILRIALASASHSDLQLKINNATQDPPLFRSFEIGQDNSISRHGIHGLYWLFTIRIPSTLFLPGRMNTLYFTQSLGNETTPWRGIMYDYIRLERPPLGIQTSVSFDGKGVGKGQLKGNWSHPGV